MKNFCKRITLLLCALCLLLALTGCDRADYVSAVEVYNTGDYAQARDLFLALGDFEDSAALAKRCGYHLAVALYSEGKFQEAITAFEALGDYEDSLALITHSKYQVALALKESGDHDAAEAAFEALNGYANSADHIADIRWARLYDTIVAQSTVAEDGVNFCYSAPEGSTSLVVSKDDPYAITLYTEMTQEDGITIFDSLSLTVHYPATKVEYAATSTFTMSWMDNNYGSTQTCHGALEPSELTAETVLPLKNYKMQSLDIQNTSHVSTDVSDSSMDAGMAANLKTLAEETPGLLQSLDSRFTMELLGLANFG